MPTNIGIASRRQIDNKRFYKISEDQIYPSVTTIENIINKPLIGPWMAKMERDMILDFFIRFLYHTDYELIADEKVMRKEFESMIGKKKKADKELTKAGNIGTQTHDKIEWYNRKLMGQDVGPEPMVSEPAEWAVMAYQDWAKSVELKPNRIEMVVYSEKYEYAGTMDLEAWVTIPGIGQKLATIDFKTGKRIYPEAYLQVAAYREASAEMGFHRTDIAMIVRLPKIESDPEFEAVVVDDLNIHFDGFLHALELWKWNQFVDNKHKGEK